MKQIVLFIIIIVASFSHSQIISTDAPSITPSASTLEQGAFQIESRFQYTKSQFYESFAVPVNLFRLGVAKKFELRMVNGINANKYGASLSQFSLGFKAQLLNKPEGKTQIAFLAEAPLPRFKSHYYSASGNITVNHSLNQKNSLAYNAGFLYSSSGLPGQSVEAHRINLSLIYAHSLTDKFTMFAEFYGGYLNFTTLNIGSSNLNFDAGFLYLITDKFQIDYSFGIGILQDMNFHAIGLNFMIGPKKN